MYYYKVVDQIGRHVSALCRHPLAEDALLIFSAEMGKNFTLDEGAPTGFVLMEQERLDEQGNALPIYLQN
jgi:hypothetical protein